MNFSLKTQEKIDEGQRNIDFYGPGRTRTEHRDMLKHTLPGQRSGRIKLVCTECERRIGPTELIVKARGARNADGEQLYRHRGGCPS